MKPKTMTKKYRWVQGMEYKIGGDLPEELLEANFNTCLIKDKKGHRVCLVSDKITHISCYSKNKWIAIELPTPFTIEEGVVGMDKLKEMEKKNKHKFPDWFQWEWDSDSEQLHLFLSESTLIVDKVQYLKKWGKK